MLEKTIKHNIEIVRDRLIVKPNLAARLTEAVELAISFGDGLVGVQVETKVQDDRQIEEKLFSTKFACPEHGISIEELEPRMFSFNSPFGACESCAGLGFTEKISEDLIVPDKDKSIADGALSKIFASMDLMASFYGQIVAALLKEHKLSENTPYKDLPRKFIEELLYGTGERHIKYEYVAKNGNRQKRDHAFEGLITNLERRYRETGSEFMKERIHGYMETVHCDSCDGKRLKKEVLSVTVGGKNIAEFSDMSIADALEFVKSLELSKKDEMIASQILKEIKERLRFLVDVGLEYLTLSRATGTLSGGEAQRIRLATQIGSGLVGVLYILDEPSIGLHQKDNEKLLKTLRRLTDIGNTLLVVEHDEDTMYAADYIVDIGPGAGIHGGEVVVAGTAEEVKACKKSITGQYLSGEKHIDVPRERRKKTI